MAEKRAKLADSFRGRGRKLGTVDSCGKEARVPPSRSLHFDLSALTEDEGGSLTSRSQP